jgi:16S rRNA (adenine1518-N6/adenine1519-N6)-dimethyltransferase
VVAAILKRHGLRPNKSLGQSFLIDRNVLERIVAAAELAADDTVLEVGAGMGTLTREIAKAARRVLAVELDRGLLAVLAETVGTLQNVTVVPGDVLKLDLVALLRQEGVSTAKVIANLPYYITTPALAAFIQLARAAKPMLVALIVVLVQKEVAARLAAAPGTDEYGALSVMAQYHAQVELVATVSRNVFLPAPKVDSSIVRLRVRDHPPVDVADERLFFDVVKAAFGQRRKTLANALAGASGLRLGRAEAGALLSRVEIDPSRRGETLSIAEFAVVANALAGART